MVNVLNIQTFNELMYQLRIWYLSLSKVQIIIKNFKFSNDGREYTMKKNYITKYKIQNDKKNYKMEKNSDKVSI